MNNCSVLLTEFLSIAQYHSPLNIQDTSNDSVLKWSRRYIMECDDDYCKLMFILEFEFLEK